jgi:hypothetical protein
MGFEDLFEDKHNHHNRSHNSYYRDDYHQQSHNDRRQHYDVKQVLLNKLQSNPKLKSLIIVVSIVVVIIVILLIALLFPLIVKLFNYLVENGLQGVIDSIWKGTK